VKQAETFATALALSNRDGSYTLVGAAVRSADCSGVRHPCGRFRSRREKTDLLLAGNFSGVQPEIGGMMATTVMLRGNAAAVLRRGRRTRAAFSFPASRATFKRLRTRRGDLYIVARNNDRPLFFRSR